MEIFMGIATCLFFGGLITGLYILFRLLIGMILNKFNFFESKSILITICVMFGFFTLSLLTILCGVIITCVFNVGG